jgi:hypothetical protein
MLTAAETAEIEGSSNLRERKKGVEQEPEVEETSSEAKKHDNAKQTQLTWGKTPDGTGIKMFSTISDCV